jgi:hypothetical protein
MVVHSAAKITDRLQAFSHVAVHLRESRFEYAHLVQLQPQQGAVTSRDSSPQHFDPCGLLAAGSAQGALGGRTAVGAIRGARRTPGPTRLRARGTKREPTSSPTPRPSLYAQRDALLHAFGNGVGTHPMNN